MSSDLLRRAADRLDELAGAVPEAPWWPMVAAKQGDGDWIVDSGPRLIAGNIGLSTDPAAEPIAAYIAALGPNVGTALAEVMRAVTETGVSDTMMRQWLEQDRTGRAMLHLARQILGPDAA